MIRELSNGILSVRIDSRGAEIVSVKKDGRERLWQNSTGRWAGHAPILFPWCGLCAVRAEGRTYPAVRHGFAQHAEFCEEDGSFVLRASEETKRIFPYDFVFRVRYALCGNALRIGYEIEDPAEVPLFFACGGHESYALPPRSESSVRLPRAESLVRLLHDEEGRLTGEAIPLGVTDEISLSEPCFQRGDTLILGNIEARSAVLTCGGVPVAKTEFEGFSNLLLWRPAGADMICIEPWQNLPDRIGEQTPFERKRGVVRVEAGETVRFSRTVTYF